MTLQLSHIVSHPVMDTVILVNPCTQRPKKIDVLTQLYSRIYIEKKNLF